MSASLFLSCDRCHKIESVYVGDTYFENFPADALDNEFVSTTCTECSEEES